MLHATGNRRENKKEKRWNPDTAPSETEKGFGQARAVEAGSIAAAG